MSGGAQGKEDQAICPNCAERTDVFKPCDNCGVEYCEECFGEANVCNNCLKLLTQVVWKRMVL